MSAKQAKRVRKAAKGLVVALDQAGKDIKARGLNYIEYRNPSVSSFRSDVAPKDLVDDPRGELTAIQAVNRPDTLRGIVRTLKKGLKSGKINKLP